MLKFVVVQLAFTFTLFGFVAYNALILVLLWNFCGWLSFSFWVVPKVRAFVLIFSHSLIFRVFFFLFNCFVWEAFHYAEIQRKTVDLIFKFRYREGNFWNFIKISPSIVNGFLDFGWVSWILKNKNSTKHFAEFWILVWILGFGGYSGKFVDFGWIQIRICYTR